MHPLLVIGGPTASGKTRWALHHAQEIPSVIINADSLQVYQGLEILTAHPSSEERNQCPHELYGVVSPEDPMTAGRWVSLARSAIEGAYAQGKRPILVGGTGLYLRSLLKGLSPIPSLPLSLRERVQKLVREKGVEGLYQELQEVDPFMAQRLHPRDTQRLSRAWEVKVGTGRSLYEWYQEKEKDPFPYPYQSLLVLPDRSVLGQAIETRLDHMLQLGVLEEVRAFSRSYPGFHLPLHKALGYEALLAYDQGKLSFEEAKRKVAQQTRQYAKRQTTWFLHQFSPDQVISG